MTLFARKLRVVKPRIEAVKRNKLFVVALLDDIAVAHDEYQIRVLYRRKSVRDYKTRSALGQSVHSGLNKLLRARVDVGRRLVEY